MRFGIHLPQFGRAAVPGGVEQAAGLAETLGFDDVWVSDHLVIPHDQPYPAPHLFDPLVTLAFAAASPPPSGSARGSSWDRSTRARCRWPTPWARWTT